MKYEIEWDKAIVYGLWAICGIVAVVMVSLVIMQASAENARFREACVNTGGMMIGNNCVKALPPATEIVK